MNAPSEDIADVLALASACALTVGTDLFCNFMPSTPDACTAVYDTGGEAPEPGFNYERPTFQVRVRGDKGDNRPAHEHAQACRDELNGTNNYTINSARYIGIWCVTDVIFVGYDDNNRPIFTVNLRAHRTDA